MSAPRILATGFGIFPGAPVNPTEALMARLAAEPPAGPHVAAFEAHVLAVEYGSVAANLSRIGAAFRPDIAIHFGLARECSSFRLERVARNAHALGKPDQAGLLPETLAICAGPGSFASSLPLDEIAAALQGGACRSSGRTTPAAISATWSSRSPLRTRARVWRRSSAASCTFRR